MKLREAISVCKAKICIKVATSGIVILVPEIIADSSAKLNEATLVETVLSVLVTGFLRAILHVQTHVEIVQDICLLFESRRNLVRSIIVYNEHGTRLYKEFQSLLHSNPPLQACCIAKVVET